MTTPHKPTSYPIGKLPQADLVRLLDHALPRPDPRVVFGPGLGRDAAVIDFGERYLVAKTDPITFATDEIGWYVVHINANDVACLGARPRWFIVTLLLPEKRTPQAMVELIFNQIRGAAEELGVSVVGGHTEITHGIDRPIAVGAMFGDVPPRTWCASDGAQVGDALILTKGIAVEGTAIVARELGGGCSARSRLTWQHAPRTSCTIRGSASCRMRSSPPGPGPCTRCTTRPRRRRHRYPRADRRGGLGRDDRHRRAADFAETRAICAALDLDPLGLIASGALLISVAHEDAEAVVAALNAEGLGAAVIGAVDAEPGVRLHDANGIRPMPQFARDEIARLFEGERLVEGDGAPSDAPSLSCTA